MKFDRYHGDTKPAILSQLSVMFYVSFLRLICDRFQLLYVLFLRVRFQARES